MKAYSVLASHHQFSMVDGTESGILKPEEGKQFELELDVVLVVLSVDVEFVDDVESVDVAADLAW